MQTSDMLLIGGAIALYLFFSGAMEGLFGGITDAFGGAASVVGGAASKVVGTAEDGLNRAGDLGEKAVDVVKEGAENLKNPIDHLDPTGTGFVSGGGVPGAVARTGWNAAGAPSLPDFPDMSQVLPGFDFGFDFGLPNLGDLGGTIRNILPF